MKKSIIYLCLIALISIGVFNSCSTDNTNDKYVTEEVTLEQVLPYVDGQSMDDILLEYNIIETNAGKEIIFGNFESYVIADIYYVKDSELKIEGQLEQHSNKERKVVPCSQDMYDSISNSELVYEYDDNSVHYYKKARDGVLYRKIVLYNNNST